MQQEQFLTTLSNLTDPDYLVSGFAELMRGAIGVMASGYAASAWKFKDFSDQQDKLIDGFRSRKGDLVAQQLASALGGCGTDPCGLAACPMCRSFADIWLSYACRKFVEGAKNPWLFECVGVPQRTGTGAADPSLNRLMETFDKSLVLAGLGEQVYKGRSHFIPYVFEKSGGANTWSVIVGVTDAPMGVNFRDRLSDAFAESEDFILFSAEQLSDGKTTDGSHAQANLDGIFQSVAMFGDSFEHSDAAGAMSKAPRRMDRMIDKARIAIARSLGTLPYTGLLLSGSLADFSPIIH